MTSAGLAISIHAGSGAHRQERALEVDAGLALPVAFGGLRKVLAALRADAPQAMATAAARHPAVWNRLFPGTVQDAPDLSDLALSPSERRLHRESEQTFWILNVAARTLLDALRESSRPLVIRNAGESDLVSLRGVMRAVEWARMEDLSGKLVLTGWGRQPQSGSERFSTRRQQHLETIRERMRAAAEGHADGVVSVRSLEPSVDREGMYLAAASDPDLSAERRIAAAILAMRACFFSTNYEGAMLAADHGLALLEQAGTALKPAEVADAWGQLEDTAFVSPAIEVDQTSLGDAEELRALLWRQVGVVHAFTGDFEEALRSFLIGAECKLSPERHAQMRMFRALTLIKRVGTVPQARAEIEAGLQGMANRGGATSSLHEGWLRNVYALTYFQEKKLEAALEQEKLALKCVGELHDPSATHLKINLISNVSVLQETGKRFTDAITTWRRFERISANWGANFTKHHSYRLAGLQLKAGDAEEAVRGYSQAYASAELLGDAFHRQGIALELGRHYLERKDSAEASRWFEQAEVASREVGDPLRLAQSLAGKAMVAGQTDFKDAQHLAEQTTSYPTEAPPLIEALASGDPARVTAAIPAPRSKLNRPFDLVNLY